LGKKENSNLERAHKKNPPQGSSAEPSPPGKETIPFRQESEDREETNFSWSRRYLISTRSTPHPTGWEKGRWDRKWLMKGRSEKNLTPGPPGWKRTCTATLPLPKC